MLAIRWRWKGKCPKHVRYNPAKDGEGGIKGACPHCRMLLKVHDLHRGAIASATVFDEIQRSRIPLAGRLPSLRNARRILQIG